MATQVVGMGLTRIIFLVGTGVVGTIVIRDVGPAKLLAGIEKMLKEVENGKGGEGKEDTEVSALLKQVSSLASEIRRIQPSSTPIIISRSDQPGLRALIVPTAALAVVGYGYMKWKGLRFSDFMYVTKRSMANAVSGMTKHLEQVSSALAAAKRHLTQRIQGLDDKLDEQKLISGKIKDEVTEARLKLSNIGTDIESMRRLVSGLDDKMSSIEEKQDISVAGVMYLCNFVESKGGKMTELIKEGSRLTGRRIGYGEPKFKGMQQILQLTGTVESGSVAKEKTQGRFNEIDS